MYAKPVVANGGTKQREDAQDVDTAFAGPSQYSLLGNDKYENVDLNEIQKAP